VHDGSDQNVCLVMEDIVGRLGRIWPEADVESTDLETVIGDLLDGQYGNPICVVAFNTGCSPEPASSASRALSRSVAIAPTAPDRQRTGSR
jgi:hypothetical protein